MKNLFSLVARTMAHSYRIGIKDLLVFARDRLRLITFVIMPIFMMVMTGYVFPTENALKHSPVGVVNLDQGPLGAQVVSALELWGTDNNNRLFDITYPKDQSDAVERIKKQESNGAVVIPAGFSATIGSGQQATITVITDESNPQISVLMSSIMDKVMSGISVQIGTREVSTLNPGLTDPEAVVQPFVVETIGVVPGNPNYFEFMAPGIMAMVIMMAAMIGLAGSVARERELGTLDGVLSAPTSRLAVVVGKSMAQVVRGLFQAALTLVLAVVLFGVVVHGNLALLALLLVLTVFSFIGIGIIVSAVSSDQETAVTIMMTLTFPMIFLSGALFPIQQMPTVMQWISKGIPLSYAVEALRKCIVLGTGIPEMRTEMLVMLGFGVVFLAVAVPVFNRATTR
ncbi:MAG: ABC transporter permease [Dehalococcoidia bacterium]|nr:ABC transporter permease [Dehalococcoidia bacterium]